MANLETLEMRINANAESASQGIGQLITSLSSLSSIVENAAGGLRSLNTELGKLKGSRMPKLDNLFGGSGGASGSQRTAKNIKETTTAMQEQINTMVGINNVAKSAKDSMRTFVLAGYSDKTAKNIEKTTSAIVDNAKAVKSVHMYTAEEMADSKRRMEAQRAEDGAKYRQLIASIRQEIPDTGKIKAFDAAKSGQLGESAKKMADYEMKKLGQETKVATQAAKDFVEPAKEAAKAGEDASKGIGKIKKELASVESVERPVNKTKTALSNLATQIGRIAKTMLIRNALRAMIKGAKEGLNNFYQYSKAVGTSYSAALDSMAVKTGTLKNQLGAAIGSALAAVVPILNAIASAAIMAANAITALFALLGGASTWSKATAGAESFGKAVGGGGSALKELLADFDELNVITSQGGGGGGGGAMDFGNMFTESPFPTWLTDFMREWKPLIDAVLAGTLGAILLPKIFGWLSKIFDLFGGDKIKNIIDLLKHWKNVDPNDLDPEDLVFPDQPKYEPFPQQPVYTPFPKPEDYSKMGTDLLTVATNAGIATAAIEALKGAVEGLVGAIGKIAGALAVGDLLKNILIPLATKILGTIGGKVSLKLDTKEFDEKKKEIDEWVKEKKVANVTIMFDQSYMTFSMTCKEIGEWVKENTIKKVGVMFDQTYMTYATTKKAIDDWLKEYVIRKIGVMFDQTYMTYATTKSEINKWLEEYVIRKIGIMFDQTYMSFVVTKNAIDKWVGEKPLKFVLVGFESSNWENFWNLAGMIDEWAGETLTKVINVAVNQTDNTGDNKPSSSTEINDLLTKKNGKSIGDMIGGPVGKVLNNIGDAISNIGATIFHQVTGYADGAMGIPSGDLFIANERGAELVGSINGKTSVANQGQIIEGISGGVARANAEQNILLREQNSLLRRILDKETNINLGASAGFGRTVRRSLDMYENLVGG